MEQSVRRRLIDFWALRIGMALVIAFVFTGFLIGIGGNGNALWLGLSVGVLALAGMLGEGDRDMASNGSLRIVALEVRAPPHARG